MEQKAMKLMAQLSFLAVLVWVLAAACGKRRELRIAAHPADRRMDPNSPVWQHSNVKGPLAGYHNAVGVAG